MPSEARIVAVVGENATARDERLYRHQDVRPRSASDPRRPARRDRDRIYYSDAFRRLAGVTQVFTPTTDGYLTHNRLTHSLKVAQVARSIGEVLLGREDVHETIQKLGGLDADVVESAGLAHDLGHPPFGHIGEDVLDRYARKHMDLHEGFEGNAQTFRIITRLEPRSRHLTGLDLTAATRAAVLKYPWFRGVEPAEDGSGSRWDDLQWKKFGAYTDDEQAFQTALAAIPIHEHVQSLEAAIMDVADDITYALHDLEDFYGARLLDLHAASEALTLWRGTYAGTEPGPSDPLKENPYESLRRKLASEYPDRFSASTFEDAAQAVQDHLMSLQAESVGTRRAHANAGRFVSQLITDFLSEVQLVENPTPDLPPAMLSPLHWHVVQLLKEITKQFVIQRPDFAVIQRGQQQLLRELLGQLCTWSADKKDRRRLPGSLAEGFDQDGPRAIIDFVSGLSDHQAAALHRTLTGHGPLSLATNFLP